MIKKVIQITSIFLFLTNFVYSAGSSGNDNQDINKKNSVSSKIKKLSSFELAEQKIEKAKKLDKKGKNKKANKLYKSALKNLFKANKQKPFDPDILNYLGFTHRKINKFEDSEIYYLMGLEIDPNHIGINEYLGELYVSTNRLDLAKERLEILKGCNCEEYQQLKDVIDGNKSSKY
jgi:tetratricopeptide (TPR) repeat protein